MTEQDWIELGRRAVACRGWRWLPGMRVISSSENCQAVRVVVEDGNDYLSAEERSLRTPSGASGRLSTVHGGGAPLCSDPPDLRDPATVGCLLALVREAWLKCGESLAFPAPYEHDEGWSFEWHSKIDPRTIWSTEAAALVAALESAP